MIPIQPPPPPPSICAIPEGCHRQYLPIVVRPSFFELNEGVIVTDCDSWNLLDSFEWNNIYYEKVQTGSWDYIDTDVLGLPYVDISVWAECSNNDEDPEDTVWAYWLGKEKEHEPH